MNPEDYETLKLTEQSAFSELQRMSHMPSALQQAVEGN